MERKSRYTFSMKLIFTITTTLLLGALFSQFPEFYQQYLQRVGGQLDGIRLEISDLDQRAASVQNNRFQYIRRLLENGDPIVQNEGHSLARLLGRQIKLQRTFDDLNTSDTIWRSVRFAQHFSNDIAIPTLYSFRPAVPITVEGAYYFSLGAFLGWLASWFLGRSFRRRTTRNN